MIKHRASILIYSITGTKFATFARNELFKSRENIVKYNVSDLAKGAYFVQISNGT